MAAAERVLRRVPGLEVRSIESSCCGMAGAFGYDPKTIDVSLAMGECSLFPALRETSADDILVADGTSCRHQIRDGIGRQALHVARVLEAALAPGADTRIRDGTGRDAVAVARALAAEPASVVGTPLERTDPTERG